jgi:plastocyanin
MKRMSRENKTFVVNVGVSRGKIEFDRCCLHVIPGDTIVWRSSGVYAFAVIVRDFVSPLQWGAKICPKGTRTVRSLVRREADYGYYPYSLCAWDGTGLLLTDPEIIVHPPGGRGS